MQMSSVSEQNDIFFKTKDTRVNTGISVIYQDQHPKKIITRYPLLWLSKRSQYFIAIVSDDLL